MRQLQDVQVEGMALVRRPANKKRFLTKKSEEASVANNSAEQLNAPSAAITDAIDAIKLAKGESADGHEALHTAAHMLAGRSDLTLQDLVAFGEAMGLEDVAKAAKKKPMDEMDDEEGDDEGGDDVDDEDEDEEDDKGKKMPKFLKDKLNKSQKPAAPSASEGEPMAAKGSEAREFVSKSDYEQLIERLTKSEGELADMRGREAMAVEKSNNEKAFAHLNVDHEALADVTYALRKSDAKKGEALETILKAVNEQMKVAKASGGSPFKPQAIRGGLAKSESQGIAQFNALVDEHVKANPNSSRAQAITAVSKSAEGLAAYRASKGDI